MPGEVTQTEDHRPIEDPQRTKRAQRTKGAQRTKHAWRTEGHWPTRRAQRTRYRLPRITGAAALGLTGALLLSACGTPSPTADGQVLRVAAVDNADMQRLADLADQFTAEHPGWNVEFDLLPEGELRQRVTTDVATTAGQFGAAQGVNIEVRPTGRYDVISVGSYEARLWAAKDWLSPMQDVVANPEDIFPTVREALTFEDAMYAAPPGTSITTPPKTCPTSI